MKHTPGPWMWDGDELWTRGHCGRPCYYMSITVDKGFEHSEELAATKLVIAAAPDMEETLSGNTRGMKTIQLQLSGRDVTQGQVNRVLALLKEMITKNETLLKKAKGEE